MYEELAAFYERTSRETDAFIAEAQAQNAKVRVGWKSRRLSDMVVGLIRLRGQLDTLMPAVVSDAQAVEHDD